VGAITGACIVLGRRTLFGSEGIDFLSVAVLLVSIGLFLAFNKLPETIVVLGAGIVGLLVFEIA
jgi:hypothetical protein